MWKYMKSKYFLLIVTILFLFISCDLIKTKISIEFDYSLFSMEKNAWKESKPQNYQYDFFRNNPGFEPEMDALVIVENGFFKEQVPKEGENWGGILLSVSPDYQTIDKIYDNIEYIYNINRTKNADESILLTKIIINYDSKNHVPIKTEFYYNVESGVHDVGNYMVYTIKNYKINWNV